MAMKLKDVKIVTLLNVSIAMIILLVLFMAGNAYIQVERVWTNTDNLYHHPLMVARATRDLKVELLLIQKEMREFHLANQTGQKPPDLLSITQHEKKIEEFFGIIYDRYLGDIRDVDSVKMAFEQWKVVRQESMLLMTDKGKDQVVKYMAQSAIEQAAVSEVLSPLQQIIDFAKAKADSFYLTASKDKERISRQMIVFLTIIILLSLIVATNFVRRVRQPLTDLMNVTNEFMKGNYDVRSQENSRNEIGLVASTFNKMAETVQQDMAIKEATVAISQRMMKENEMQPFCQLLLDALMKQTRAQIAAFYMLDVSNNRFEHFVSIGLDQEGLKSFSADSLEGEFGPVLLSKKIESVRKIPKETRFLFPTFAGTFVPREIVSIPILDGDKVIAIISLAAMRDFTDLDFRFLEGVLPMLTARVLGVMAYQKSQDFALKLNLQNEELHRKSTELTYQSDELKEYNLELEMQKKQLDEANRLKSAFLSNMSHELRTPLNSVIALSGVLTKRLKGAVSEDEYNYLGIIERNGRNLLELINDILDLSRIEAGKESVIMSEFSLLPVFEFIIDSVMPTAMNKNLKVVNRINPRLRGIVSDHAKCIHIFQNIFSNAVKFTEEGSIEINAEVINGEMVVSIKDTGIGISKENLPYIFDEFRQADDQTSRRYGGTGLGLAISKKYTQLLDGTIEVFSQPGEGSEFIVKLPMNPAGEYDLHPNENRQFARQTPDPRPPVAPKELSGKSLLLVEDSEPQIIQMMDILSEAGFPVRVARNGSEALAEIGKQLPDAIILDLMMPEVDGFEVLKQIRLHKDTSKIPVLILSAKYITKEELSFLKENHIYQLIQKGDINKKDLLMHITNMVLPLKSENRGIENLQQPESPEKKDAVILVVEDNEDNIASITALLGERYPVHIARNGADGLELARRLVPDLILLDVSLPLLDGTEVLKAIKTEPETGHIPVIVLTARAMKGDREALLDIGFDDYISKPIDNDYFNSIIKKWLNGR